MLTEGICCSSKNVQKTAYTEASKQIRFRTSTVYFYCIRQTKNALPPLLIKERHIQDAECFKETPIRIKKTVFLAGTCKRESNYRTHASYGTSKILCHRPAIQTEILEIKY